MRSVILSLLMAFSVNTFAQDISVVIDGKTYQCSGTSGSSNCSAKVQGFEALIDACLKAHAASYCFATLWKSYKKANPNCIYEGISICLDTCIQAHDASYCIIKCQ